MNLQKIRVSYRSKNVIYKTISFGFWALFIVGEIWSPHFKAFKYLILSFALIYTFWSGIELFVTETKNRFFGTLLYRFKSLIEHEDPIQKAEKRRLYDKQLEDYKLRKNQKL